MASLETLSDGELRRKLIECGYPVGPVTDTTRKIYLKKLKQLIEKRSSDEVTGKKNRRSLSRFSSGEEESEADEDSLTMPPPVSKNTPRSSSRRKSSGVKTNVSPPNTAAKTEFNTRDSSDGGQREYTSKTRAANTIIPGLNESNHSTLGARSRRSTRSTNESFIESKSSLIRDGFETGSDSDVAGDEPVSSDNADGSLSSNKSYLSSVSSRLGFSSERTNVSDTYEPRKRQSTKSDTRPYTPNGHHNFSSLFTSQKPSSPSSTSTSPLPVNHPLSSFSITHKQRSPPMITTQFGAASTPVEEEKKMWDSQFVSMVLLGVAALFFLAIGLTYMSVRYKDSSISSALDAVSQDGPSKENIFDTCEDGASKDNCVAKNDIQPAIELFRLLHPWLEGLAAKAQCEGGWFGDTLTVDAAFVPHSKAVDYLVNATSNIPRNEVEKRLRNLKLIMQMNPHWGVKIVSTADAISAGLKGEQIKEYYVVPEPPLPWSCILRLKLKSLLISIVVVGGGFLTLWWSQVGVSWYMRRKEAHQREVYRLVEQAIALLSAHQQHQMSLGGGAEASAIGEGTYLAINHVRDQLIPPSERQKKAALWEEVVKFLEERESRVRMEVQMVSGEEFRVWRWLPSHSTPLSSPAKPTSPSTLSQSFGSTYSSTSAGPSSNSVTSLHRSQMGLNHHHQSQQQTQKRKVWQGQAFETMEGSVNSLPCSPTPCLKIRHMFDPEIEYGEAWIVATEDAVLEKCEESGAAVVHVAVDRSSVEGCVYIKCASRADAGRAYRGMHGWWFDGNLVTVKYLRLERYHERFPEAASIPPNTNASTSVSTARHCRPSNNKRLSLQGRHWQSPIERT